MARQSDSAFSERISHQPRLRQLKDGTDTLDAVLDQVFTELEHGLPKSSHVGFLTDETAQTSLNDSFAPRSDTIEHAASSSNTQINILTLFCSESSEAAALFNRRFLSLSQPNPEVNSKIWWKLLHLFQSTYWLDKSTKVTRAHILILELIDRLIKIRSNIPWPSNVTASAIKLINRETEGSSASQDHSRSEKNKSLSSAWSDEVPVVVQTIFYAALSYSCCKDDTVKSIAGSPISSKEDLWSPDPFQRIGAAKYFQVDPLMLLSANTPNTSMRFYLWVMLELGCKQPDTSEDIIKSKSLASDVLGQAFHSSITEKNTFLGSMIRDRQYDNLYTAFISIALANLNSETSKYSLTLMSDHFLTILSDYDDCKAHAPLSAVCDILREVGAASKFLAHLPWYDCSNLFRSMSVDPDNNLQIKIMAIQAAGSLVRQSPDFAWFSWQIKFIEDALKLIKGKLEPDLIESVTVLVKNFIGCNRLLRSDAEQFIDISKKAWGSFSFRIPVAHILLSATTSSGVKLQILLLMANAIDYIKDRSRIDFGFFMETAGNQLLSSPSVEYANEIIIVFLISLASGKCESSNCEYIIDVVQDYLINYFSKHEKNVSEALKWDFIRSCCIVMTRASHSLMNDRELHKDSSQRWHANCELISHAFIKDAKLEIRGTMQTMLMILDSSQ